MALAQAAVADESAPNHPSAKWMAAIAWMSHNMVVGCLMGSFSVMLAPVQERLHVALEKAAVGMLLVLVGSALTGPFVGVLIARFSLRRVRVGRMSIRGARSSHDSGGCARVAAAGLDDSRADRIGHLRRHQGQDDAVLSRDMHRLFQVLHGSHRLTGARRRVVLLGRTVDHEKQ